MSRLKGEPTVAVRLACGDTFKDAAAAGGIGESTARARWTAPAYRTRVSELRGDLLARATGILSDASADAARYLAAVARGAPGDARRVNACRLILTLAPAMRETTEIDARVSALEREHTTGASRNGHRTA